MPYPVLPPVPPAVVDYIPSENPDSAVLQIDEQDAAAGAAAHYSVPTQHQRSASILCQAGAIAHCNSASSPHSEAEETLQISSQRESLSTSSSNSQRISPEQSQPEFSDVALSLQASSLQPHLEEGAVSQSSVDLSAYHRWLTAFADQQEQGSIQFSPAGLSSAPALDRILQSPIAQQPVEPLPTSEPLPTIDPLPPTDSTGGNDARYGGDVGDDRPSEATPLDDADGGQLLIIPTPDSVPASPADSVAPSDSGASQSVEQQPEMSPSAAPSTAPGAAQSPTEVPGTLLPVPDIVELSADRQEYDTLRQTLFAQGNVQMRFRQSILNADQIQVNLPNRTALAEGDVLLVRGQQVLQGDRITYNFVQQRGNITNASGQVFVPNAGDDFAAEPTVSPAIPPDTVPLSQTILSGQPLQGVIGQPGLTVGVGAGQDAEETLEIEGDVNRLRFEAESIEIVPDGWVARNVSLTNDPFSPPELELRSPEVTFTRLTPTLSELRARNPRIVFDRGLALPFLISRVLIGPRDNDPGLVSFGFDEEERGGFYIERPLPITSRPGFRFSITPQVLVQRAIDEDGFLDLSSYGLLANLSATLGPDTVLRGAASFSSLDLSEVDENLRASLRVQQRIFARHLLSLEYSYRDRLFNGSLGFQDVEQSLGFVITSPSYTLGTTGISLQYQGGFQFIQARTDQDDIEPSNNPDNPDRLANLTRLQLSATLSRSFLLWQGTPLPLTPTEGLRYTPSPVVPYLSLYSELRGTYSDYSSGDYQSSLRGSIGLRGQVGHFSRPLFDYTGFSVTYSETLGGGESPFLFDRDDDQRVLSLGLVQQIYGPLRFGIRTSINLDRDREIDTEYTLEYSRRTYSITLRFNPVRESGSLNLQINDFNWTGNPEPFSGIGSSSIDAGVRRN